MQEAKLMLPITKDGVCSTLPISTRGLTRRTNLKELSRTKAVSCTFETGSIGKDYEIFIKQHDQYGKGLALGLCNYLGIPFNTPGLTILKLMCTKCL